MSKVYLVYEMYHEHDDQGEDVYTADCVLKVFDSEDKTIDYIRERIKNDHEEVDAKYPGDEHVIKYNPDSESIRQGCLATSFEYNNLMYITIGYLWKSYDVE